MKAQTIPPASIPFAFFATSVATLGATLFWAAFGAPGIFALLHLLVIGVFAMTAMGALYQFVPVVGMAPLRFRTLAYVHLALAIAGTVFLILGFQTARMDFVFTGGMLHATGACVELVVLLATLAASRNAGMPARLASLAFSWLIATMIAGMFVARGTLAPGVHGAIGLAGFYGTLITAISFRLLKMFERVNVETRAPVRAALVTVSAIIAAVAIRAGTILLSLAAAVYVADLVSIARRRNPAYQPETLFYALASGLGALAAAIAAAFGMWYVSVVLAVWFFIGCAVVGYIQRIVPFIWWIRRSRLEGARNVPLLERLTSHALGVTILALWLAAGLWWLAAPFTAGPPALALAAWLALLLQLAKIRESPHHPNAANP